MLRKPALNTRALVTSCGTSGRISTVQLAPSRWASSSLQADAAAPQQQQDADATAQAANGAATSAPSGPPFTIRLCTNKGESALWGSNPDEIDKDNHRWADQEQVLRGSPARQPQIQSKVV